MTRYPGDSATNKGKKWNVKQLQAIPTSWRGDTISDGGGLNGEVKVSNAGKVSISFKYTFRLEGKNRKFYCGTFPSISLESIRKKRDQAKSSVSQKIHPKNFQDAIIIQNKEKVRALLETEKAQKVSNLTVANLFEEWIKLGVHRKDENKQLRSMFINNLLPKIGNLELKNLNEQILIKALQDIAVHKQTTAFEQFKDFKQMMGWGEKRHPWRKLISENNVAELVDVNNFLPKNFSKKRERVLSDMEIINCRRKIQTLNLKYKDKWNENTYSVLGLVFWICISTLCRVGELSKAEWAHFDFKKNTWFIPAENAKGVDGKKTDHLIFLSDFALKKIKQLHAISGGHKWLFPNKSGNSNVSENYFSKLIGDRQVAFKTRTKKFRNRIENDDLMIGDKKWTLHDLRRSGATKIQSFIPGPEGIMITKLCLHHKILQGAAGHYLHHKYFSDMKDAWIKLGVYLERLDLD